MLEEKKDTIEKKKKKIYKETSASYQTIVFYGSGSSRHSHWWYNMGGKVT